MPGSNYSFMSGANTGLNFSGNDDAEEPVEPKSPMRMAGEVFSNQNDLSNSSVDTPKTTGSWWRNQYSDMMSADVSSIGNSIATQGAKSSPASQPQQGGAGLTYKASGPSPEQKAANAARQAEETRRANAPVDSSQYAEEDYKYYASGYGTGAQAYAKDMANYNNANDKIKSMPGVHAMMHPDWSASQKSGKGDMSVTDQDWSQQNKEYNMLTRNGTAMGGRGR